MAQYRSHKRKIPKERRIGGWRVSMIEWLWYMLILLTFSSSQSALNNPGTSKEGRAHARRQLILVS